MYNFVKIALFNKITDKVYSGLESLHIFSTMPVSYLPK